MCCFACLFFCVKQTTAYEMRISDWSSDVCSSDLVGPGETLRAVFPGGTITGCPKVRVMQIIAELEGEGRGPYTGAFGYISRDGRLDSNILIRSMVWQRGEVSFRAGAGIVADSQPDAGLPEPGARARGPLLAAEAGPRR